MSGVAMTAAVMTHVRDACPVLAAAANAQVCGALWYSPLLFGSLWARKLYPQKAQRDKMGDGMGRRILIGVLLDLLLFSILRQYRIGGSGAGGNIFDMSMSVLTLTLIQLALSAVHTNWQVLSVTGSGAGGRWVVTLIDVTYDYVKMFLGVYLMRYVDNWMRSAAAST